MLAVVSFGECGINYLMYDCKAQIQPALVSLYMVEFFFVVIIVMSLNFFQ